MSIKEYMKDKNVSRQTIYNRIEKGMLKTVKEGNKIYIIKEIENSSVPAEITKLNLELGELKKHLEIIRNSYEMLKTFDYNFLRARLSSIEKALVDFKIDEHKKNEILIQKIFSFTENINERLESIEKRMEKLEVQKNENLEAEKDNENL